jgi:hypothetical protein
MARVSHWVVSFDLEDWKNPRLIVHGAFTAEANALMFRDKINEDLTDDEPHAEVRSEYNSFLRAEFMEDKSCFKVEVFQEPEKGHVIDEKTVVNAHRTINTEGAFKREVTDDGLHKVTWTGWATSANDAAMKAKVRALASWRG